MSREVGEQVDIDQKRLPGGYILGGILVFIFFGIFYAWVVYTAYVSNGWFAALILALSISLPVKFYLAPRILKFLSSKKVSG